jgi:hypothetical protein
VNDTVLYRMRARLTESVPIGVVPEGLRVDNSFEGVITGGSLDGARVQGVDYYLIRPDLTGVIDAREVIIPAGGLAVAARAQGLIHPPAGAEAPPLEALLDPAFDWPDVPFAIEVFQTFTAAAGEHAYLNDVVVSHLGWVNYATRELQIEARVLKGEVPRAQAALAGR